MLAYADSDEEAPARSLARSFSDRFSLESSGTSDTRRKTHSAGKSQRTPSKNKEPSHLRRSRRLEDRSRTKEKTRRERPKSRGKRSGHQETSSDSEYEEGKVPRNIRVYEGNKDPKDHLGIFSAAVEQEEWPMPVWCKMYRQTLGEAARNWFDDLDPKSVDSFEELSQKFLEEFSQQKRYAKDPTEIHGIKRRQNEGLQAFMDRFKSESSHIKKDTFIPLIKTPKEILAMESVSFPEPPPLTGTPEKQNLNKFCDCHGDRGHNTNDCYQLKKQIEEVMASGSWPIWTGLTDDTSFQRDTAESMTDETHHMRWKGICKIIKSKGFLSTAEVHQRSCFSGETYNPLGIIDLQVTMGEAGRNETVLMEFAIVKCRSPYNVIIGRTGMRSLTAIGSTIHSMIKFPTNQGIVTIETSREALWECRQLEMVQDVLCENIEVFAWAGSERTAVPRFVMEHQLKIYPLAKPVVHKRRPMTPDERQALKERVFRWLKEGRIRKIQHPE
ncbi:reverse transcriptase domain-containing protein [Tanacetum coccineum]